MPPSSTPLMRSCTSAVTLPPLFHAGIDMWCDREFLWPNQLEFSPMHLHRVAARVPQACLVVHNIPGQGPERRLMKRLVQRLWVQRPGLLNTLLNDLKRLKANRRLT